MRVRTLLFLSTMVLGVMILSGVALAVNKACTTTNPCKGTNGPDRLIGTSGENQIYGLGGPDYIEGKGAEDKLYGGPGNDKIWAADNLSDKIDCGPGEDTAYVDAFSDKYWNLRPQLGNCEHLKRIVT